MMIRMFWAEKYVMAAIVTLSVRKLFRQKGTKDMWMCALLTGASLILMNLGASLLYPHKTEEVIFGIAEGIFWSSLLLLVWTGIRALRKTGKRRSREEAFDSPGEERISRYTKALNDLSKAFLSVPAGNTPAIVGMDDYQKVHAAWRSRMEDQRVAVAAQLTEISQIMEGAVRRAYDTKEDAPLEKVLRKGLAKKGILLKRVYIYENEDHRKEVYLTIRTKKKHCISNKEAAEVLSETLGVLMMPSGESRAFVRNEYTSTCFVEQTNFKVLYGAERSTGDHQKISGDSFSFMQKEDGEFLASLSDGMGSGLLAYQESEKVLDLLEQFLEAGFSKEAAVRMINSALVLREEGTPFSTIDISSIDLYSGMCEFLKIGAATSFIRRGNWVEAITSTSLPAGVFWRADLEKSVRKLYDGDMIIMMTDGVLNALPPEHQEKIMKDIILEHPTSHPGELAEYIRNRVEQYKNGRLCDDMTILVIAVWKR